MRNLLAYPVTHDEIAQHLTRAARRELEHERIGDMAPTLLGSAHDIVMREQQIIETLKEIVAAMRGSTEEVPGRFITMVEAAIPRLDEFGSPCP